MKALIPIEQIETKIYQVRGVTVMLDRDLAELYGVETRVLKQAVRRNIKRFPVDFMFELTEEETDNWRSQFVISNRDKMGLRYKPMAFTEQGLAMLSGVLNSDRAIMVNIQIMRAFTKLRKMRFSYEELKTKIDAVEKNCDRNFSIVFDTLDRLLRTENSPKRKIGF